MKTITHLPAICTIAVAALGVTVFGLRGQNADPFVKNQPAAAGPNAKQAPPRPLRNMVGLLLEYVQVDHKEAVRLLRKHAGALDSTALRVELEEMIKSDRAQLIDTVYAVTPSGQRTSTSTVDEKIYATEYDPPELPHTVMLQNKEGGIKAPLPDDVVSGVKTAANPTAFETRNVGVTLEADVVVGQDGRSISCQLAPEVVKDLGWRYFMNRDSPYHESKDIRMPTFYTMKTTTSLTINNGESALLGCFNPREDKGKRVLALLRVDILR